MIGVCASTPVGAVHDTTACALPAVAEMLVGAGGKNKSKRESVPPPPPAAIVIVLLAVETVTLAPAAIVMPPVRALRADTPAGSRAASIVPDAIAAASCACVDGVNDTGTPERAVYPMVGMRPISSTPLATAAASCVWLNAAAVMSMTVGSLCT